MAAAVYDAIVIGAGVEGSYTAYHLAKNGQRTLMLEQFPLPHSRGSSHGHSRITRKAYTDDFYVRMMKEAYDLWFQLERETGTKIYNKTGLIAVGKEGGDFVTSVENAVRNSGEPCDVLSPKQFRQQYPMLSYPQDYGAVLDGVGGFLWADKALTGIQKVFVENGGEIRSREKMLNLFPGKIITVKTTKSSYRARSVVICAGPWAPQIIKPLGIQIPLKPIRVTVCYWREKTEGVYGYGNFPGFIDAGGADGTEIYGIPAAEYPGHMKICLHGGPDTNPDVRDDPSDEWVVNATTKYVRRHFAGLHSDRPSIKETCIYTMTPDSHCILDTHPHWKNIVIGAGFSGHGFKLSPVVGKVLSELAVGKSPSYDLSPFKMNRFNQKSNL